MKKPSYVVCTCEAFDNIVHVNQFSKSILVEVLGNSSDSILIFIL